MDQVALRSVSTEWLLWWTYQRQRADVVIDRGVGLYDAELAADGIVARKASPDGVHLICTTGGRVDGGGKANGELHPDAETVHRAVLQMDRAAQAVLMTYVRLGQPPDPMLGVVPALRPKRDHLGRTLYQRDRRGKKVSAVMELHPPPETVAMQRRAYVEWYQVMQALTQALLFGPRLEAHTLFGMEAAAPSW